MKSRTKRKTSSVGQKLIEGLNEALSFELGEREDLKSQVVELPPEPRTFKPREVVKARASLGLSQVHFARVLGVSPGAVRSWEQGQKSLSGAASRLLEILELDPKVFARIGKGEVG